MTRATYHLLKKETVAAKHLEFFVMSLGELREAHYDASFKAIFAKLEYERSPKIGIESPPSVPGDPWNEMFGEKIGA